MPYLMTIICQSRRCCSCKLCLSWANGWGLMDRCALSHGALFIHSLYIFIHLYVCTILIVFYRSRVGVLPPYVVRHAWVPYQLHNCWLFYIFFNKYCLLQYEKYDTSCMLSILIGCECAEIDFFCVSCLIYEAIIS